MRYIIGILGVPLGIIIIVYREKIKRFTGDMGFAERWFGPGGTYTFILIFGIGVSILSMLWMFGVLQSMGTSFLSPLFQGGE